MHRTLNRAACSVLMLLALAAPAVPAAGQAAPAPGVPPQVMEHHLARRATGTMKIHGIRGNVDYENGVAPAQGPVGLLVAPGPGVTPKPEAALGPAEEAAWVVDVNWAFLDALDNGGPRHATVALPNGELRELAFVRKTDSMGPGSSVWVGQIAGIPASDFVLSRYEERIDLTVREYEKGERFDVRYSIPDGGHRLRLIKRSGGNGVCGTCGEAGEDCHVRASTRAADETPQSPGDGDTPGAADPTDEMDIAFLATNQVLDRLGPEGFVAWIQGAVNNYNEFILPNSGVSGRIRVSVVLGIPGGYNEAATFDDDLDAITDGTVPFGFLADARELARADQVALIRQAPVETSPGSGRFTVGLAWTPRSIGQLRNTGSGFSVTCLGFGDPLGTFAHEITHNVGALHDPANTTGTTDFTEPYGFHFTCPNPLFFGCLQGYKTVMAYDPRVTFPCGDAIQLTFFSNPQTSITLPFPFEACNPAFLGVAGVNNVAQLVRNNRAITSQWYVASSRQWVAPWGQPGGQGTQFRPWGGIRDAAARVQGPAGEAEMLVVPGTYAEASPGNSTLLNRPSRIINLNPGAGPVVLR